MYKAIRSHPTTLDIYAKRLVGEGVVTDGEVEKMRARRCMPRTSRR